MPQSISTYIHAGLDVFCSTQSLPFHTATYFSAIKLIVSTVPDNCSEALICISNSVKGTSEFIGATDFIEVIPRITLWFNV